MSDKNEDEEILERLKLIRVPAKAYYLVLADEHTTMRLIVRRILTGLGVAAVQTGLTVWSYANAGATVTWVMAGIGVLGGLTALQGVKLLWRRGKNLREAREARETLEGAEGWLWRHEGRVLAGIADNEPEYVVESALEVCRDSRDRVAVEDDGGLLEYWLWAATVQDHALISLGRAPIGGAAHGRLGEQYEKLQQKKAKA